MNQMVKNNYNPERHGEGECVVCFETYEADQQVVELPCDERHFFHTKCIEDWLKKNNSCPLCKKPITQEDLRRQKQNARRAARN